MSIYQIVTLFLEIEVICSICNHHVKNFVDLGQHYLQQGKTKLGKQLVEQGLANIKLVYKEDEIDKTMMHLT
ncbi:hypothetical protein B4V02_16540 [Paenibacillus kribbensis]|uniref:Uncharacterized protein n=1 Tax=Paenibacillus kribbensis TaxID=172713 RepID=A0A222WNS2_9BACL|nr:hypothetical protein [Paenibacillus kribbensis]ASR48190.1 hypothetical protein B4V02_16540 [Paenibacillus kribbensis]